MKIVAAIFADFSETFLGGPSRLDTRIGSRAVIEHTLTRLARVGGLDQRCLVVRERDEQVAAAVARKLGFAEQIDVLAIDDGSRPRRRLLRAARVWNLDCWRGSPLGTTWFDEYVEPLAAARVLDHYEASAVLCLDGHMPALDVDIVSRMVAYQREHADEAPFVFTQAPPGLAGIVLGREVMRDLLERKIPVGLLLSYRPDAPQQDPITKSPCCRIGASVSQTSARLTADTIRGGELLAGAFATLGEDCDAEALCEWLRAPGNDRAAKLPIEIEIELTTDDPLPRTKLRPRGQRVPRRQVKEIDAVVRVAEQLAAYDDRLLVLGGHGDPLLHPRFAELVPRLRAAGVCGIGVETSLAEFSQAALDALIGNVDVVEIRLDANNAATYLRVHGEDAFDSVMLNIERIENARQASQSPQPLVVCSMTRCAETLDEVEAFFDRWTRAMGWAVLRGYNEYRGLLPADTLLSTEPHTRRPCRRLDARMMLLADGAAVLCGQDVAGEIVLGSWIEQSLEELWSGEILARARESHSRLALDDLAICASCGEWNRP